jgi:hypothetical protein
VSCRVRAAFGNVTPDHETNDAVDGAVAYGLVLPTLGRTWAIHRFNRRIDALERTRAGG